MRVAILGCGPSGLIAAHAACLYGASVDIYSKKRQSELFGAQYLHEPIPGLDCGPASTINYTLRGSLNGYRQRVYGPDYAGRISLDDYQGEHKAYDIRRAYGTLWDWYEGAVIDTRVTPFWLGTLTLGGYDLIISSIPLPQMCLRGHTFFARDIWAMGDAPERGIEVPFECPDNTVICNGLANSKFAWYRLASIFGYRTVEWPMKAKVTIDGMVAKVPKPLWNNCDCWPTVERVGRFGEWKKGVLVHDAFNKTAKLVSELVWS